MIFTFCLLLCSTAELLHLLMISRKLIQPSTVTSQRITHLPHISCVIIDHRASFSRFGQRPGPFGIEHLEIIVSDNMHIERSTRPLP